MREWVTDRRFLQTHRGRAFAVIGDEWNLLECRALGNEACQEFRLIAEPGTLDVESHHMRSQIQWISVVVRQPITARQIDQARIQLGDDGTAKRPVSNFHEMRNDNICRTASADGLFDQLHRFHVVARDRAVIATAPLKGGLHEVEGKPTIDLVTEESDGRLRVCSLKGRDDTCGIILRPVVEYQDLVTAPDAESRRS